MGKQRGSEDSGVGNGRHAPWLDEVVEVGEEAGRIVIEPVRSKTYDPDDLLNGITPKNLHEPIDFGSSEGKEVW